MNICPHPAYRLLAAKVVLVFVTGLGYLTSGYADAPTPSAVTPAFCLSSEPTGEEHGPGNEHHSRDEQMFSLDVTVTGVSRVGP